jgi:hypothetical protein
MRTTAWYQAWPGLQPTAITSFRIAPVSIPTLATISSGHACRRRSRWLRYEPVAVTMMRRERGLTSHSRWKICCHVPSTRWPPEMGTVSDGPIRVA